MRNRRHSCRKLRLVGPLMALAVAEVGFAQQGLPSFEARGAAITVDAVVVDEDGQPVRDLSRSDFAVYEDGEPQTIVGFERRDAVEPGEALESVPGARDRDPGGASGTLPARVFAIVIDDLGISPVVAGQVRNTVGGWIAQAREDDEVSLITTSGEVWWSDVVQRGREDLLAALERVKGQSLASSGGDSMSDWEAYRIAAFEQSTEGIIDPAERSRTPNFVGTQRQGADGVMYYVQRLTGNTTVERVAQRWLDDNVCPRCVDPMEMSLDCKEVRVCRARVQSRANEIYAAWLRRKTAVYDTLARVSRSLDGAPGRKAVVLISEELFEDSRLNPAADVIDAAQRSNTAVYFLGARGLATTSLYSAAGKSAARAQDVSAISIEEGFLVTAGGVALAEDTGGTAVTTSNDLAAGLERIADDASSYYLLGYQPREEPDGEWHDLRVEVTRPGVEVRARKKYLAHTPVEERVASEGSGKGDKKEGSARREVSPALLAGGARPGLPLRLAALVQEPSTEGLARVQVILEVDNGRVEIDRASLPWKAVLDVTIMAANPGRRPVVPVDERLDLSLDAKQVDSGWWLIPRDIWLPPGVTQVRAFVRDVRSGKAGLVTDRIVVPPVDQAYLSTPMLSDRTMPGATPGAPPRLVPTASRTFGQRPELHCQFEAFLFGAWNLQDAARLVASHTLRRLDGTTVVSGAPTSVGIESHHAIRRLTLPLDALEPGPYSLTLTVKDLVTQRVLETEASFLIANRTAASLQ